MSFSSVLFLFLRCNLKAKGLIHYGTGIKRANVCILEHHLAYSLSQEKTTTRLYIMKYTDTAGEELRELHIKDVISRFVILLTKDYFGCLLFHQLVDFRV